MYFALDENGNRVNIKKATRENKYFCPVCGEELIIRKGEIKAHHFAHKPDCECYDSWHYDMTVWHSFWQSKFPSETQEIVKQANGRKHRADVLIENVKTVIEFQHSPMTPEEFEERNDFYNSLGYKVIWVFDATQEWRSDQIEDYKQNNMFKWSRPRRTFSQLSSEDRSDEVEIWLQFANEPKGDNDIAPYLDYYKENGCFPFTSLENYYSEIEESEGWLVKVTWIAPGFKYFTVEDDCGLLNDDFVHYVLKDKQIKTETENGKTFYLVPEDGNFEDTVSYRFYKDHTKYYVGCPLSTTGLCCFESIDLNDGYLNQIKRCESCEYHTGYMGCTKRIKDALPASAEIISYTRGNDGRIDEIKYSVNGHIEITRLKKVTLRYGHSVFDLWKKYKPALAVFCNLRTGYFIKLYKDPAEHKKKYGKCYGRFSKDQTDFSGDNAELYGLEKPEWVLVSKR